MSAYETLEGVKLYTKELIGVEFRDRAVAAAVRAEGAVAGLGRRLFLPESYGAVGDGVADDAAAVNAAIAAAVAAGGGDVVLSGTYGVRSPVGSTVPVVAGVNLVGRGDVVTGLKALSNVAPVGGVWQHSTIRGITIDAGLKGSPAVAAHFDKVTLDGCLVDGWTGRALSLNDSGDDIGLLNRITNNHIVQRDGVGIWTTYRFVDSWITGNNIGSTGPNLSVEAGPLRITGNHLNGAPEVNIELRGNQRVTITDNILEGARGEAIRYTMPPWLAEDHPQIQITSNAISNGGKGAPGTKPAIGIYGVAADKLTNGFSIVGNIIACQDTGSGWTYAVEAQHAGQVVATGNQWELGYLTAPVSGNVTSVGNTS